MSDALITKYRPTAFDQVKGQDAVVRSLQAALKKGSSRTFMFGGPAGTGKTTLARLAAQAAGCLPQDITEVDGATQTGIDDMRAVTATLMYRPVGAGKAKAIIVDEAQGLSKSAITSLLKTLEEPPAHAYWMLCTTEPARLPQAVITRCTRYDLKPVSFEELAKLLDGIAEAEKLKVSDEVIDLCAAEASGSPRQAIANLAACSEATSANEAKELLRSAIENEEVIAIARALAKDASWREIQLLLGKLGEVNPESARHIIRAYFTKVALSSKSEEQAGRALEVLECFLSPFHSSDGVSPLLMACGKAVLGSR